MAVDMTQKPILVVKDLNVHYDTGKGPAKAVNDVPFSLRPGERLGLIGESGSGKTTMATALMRLTRAPGRIVSGSVELDGQDLLKLSDKDLREVRLRDIALMPQGAMSSLNPVMRLEEQMIDAIVAHVPNLKRPELDARVQQLLKQVGLAPEVARRYPHELSGGMKQRAAMAIATSLSPKVIVADEPTSALDVVVQRQVMQTLGRLQDGLGAAVVLIGHDMGLIAQFADIVGVMYAGKIVESAPVDALFADPQHPYTIGLLGSIPRIEVDRERLSTIEGSVPSPNNQPKGCRFAPRCPFADPRCHLEPPPLRDLGPEHRVACWKAPVELARAA